MIPKTRPITVVIHEPVFEPLRLLAEETTGGSVSKLVCYLILNELLRCHKISEELVSQLH